LFNHRLAGVVIRPSSEQSPNPRSSSRRTLAGAAAGDAAKIVAETFIFAAAAN